MSRDKSSQALSQRCQRQSTNEPDESGFEFGIWGQLPWQSDRCVDVSFEKCKAMVPNRCVLPKDLGLIGSI
jgi:hypothetical protein